MKQLLSSVISAMAIATTSPTCDVEYSSDPFSENREELKKVAAKIDQINPNAPRAEDVCKVAMEAQQAVFNVYTKNKWLTVNRPPDSIEGNIMAIYDLKKNKIVNDDGTFKVSDLYQSAELSLAEGKMQCRGEKNSNPITNPDRWMDCSTSTGLGQKIPETTMRVVTPHETSPTPIATAHVNFNPDNLPYPNGDIWVTIEACKEGSDYVEVLIEDYRRKINFRAQCPSISTGDFNNIIRKAGAFAADILDQ